MVVEVNMADFHFIRPYALLAIFILLLALYLLKKFRVSQSGWQQLLPVHLSKVLMDGDENNRQISLLRSLTLPFIIGLLAIVALAGPTWQKLPQPVYQLKQGSVLIMDMSYSMYATDLSPNRLIRARYKAIDLLDNLNEGDIGLVAYAGDAFTISPLTQDSNNIKLLLPSLTPDIMPEYGSNPLAALELAHTMLTNAGHAKGDIYWFTDGIDFEDIQDITDWSRKHPHRLNILGIGTKNGAPIKLTNGELMKDYSGAIIVPKLTEGRLLGSAQRGRGAYRTINNDSTDILALLEKANEARTLQNDESKKTDDFNIGDQWQESGPYLLLVILPLLLNYFRRGNLLISLWLVMPLAFIVLPAKQVYASEANQTQPTVAVEPTSQISANEEHIKEHTEEESFQHSVKKHWNNLWKTNDQQAQEKFDQKDFSQAAQQFDNNLWQGSAHYRAGEFEQALESFQKSDSAQALYNQGNSLAKLQKLDEAIKAYDQALKKDPQHEDALTNKNLLEQLKQQQEQQQKDQQGDDQQQDNKDAEQSESEQEKSDQQGEQQEQQEQQSDDAQDQQGESSQEQQKDEQQEKEAQENQQQSEQEKQEQQRKEQEAAQAAENEQGEKNEQDAQAQLITEKLAQEKEQKHQQLLNKVTDDPYLLLRNKMQLESRKRNQNRSSAGVKKKW